MTTPFLTSKLTAFLEIALNQGSVEILLDALVQIGIDRASVAGIDRGNDGNLVGYDERTSGSVGCGVGARPVVIGGHGAAKSDHALVAILAD